MTIDYIQNSEGGLSVRTKLNEVIDFVNSGASGGFTSPPNIVQVDPDESEVAGERYTTISGALTYIATQTPTASGSWAIKLSGTWTEAFALPPYVHIIGEPGVTFLNGDITSTASAVTGQTGTISNCTITSIVLNSTSYAFMFHRCNINDSIHTIRWQLGFFSDCTITNLTLATNCLVGGFFTNCSLLGIDIGKSSTFDRCTMMAGATKFHIRDNCTFNSSNITIPTTFSITSLKNLTFESSYVTYAGSGVTFTTGNIYVRRSNLYESVTINGDANVSLEHSSLMGTITINNDIDTELYINHCTGSSSIVVNGGYCYIQNQQISVTVNGGELNLLNVYNGILEINSGTVSAANMTSVAVTHNGGVYTYYGSNYDNSSSGLTAQHTQAAIDELATTISGLGGGSFTTPPNLVQVDPDESEVAGERYTTISGALDYIATQSPTSSGIWGVKVSGINFEIFTIPSYVSIIGEKSNTILAGKIYSSDPTPGNVYINDCIIADLSVASGGSIILNDCTVVGGTSDATFIMFMRCQVAGGDFSQCGTVMTNWSWVSGGSYPLTTNIDDCKAIFMYCYVQGSLNLQGGYFQHTNIDLETLTLNIGKYDFIQSKVWINNGSTIDLNNSVTFRLQQSLLWGDGYIHVNAGAILQLYGVRNHAIQIVDDGGTITYSGDTYDNRTSGLTATNIQSAIDELVTTVSGLSFTSPPNIVQVDPDESEVAGERYTTISGALTYISTQSPSSTNRWGIKVGGVNNENFELPEYVAIIGEPNSTILNGQITSVAPTNFDSNQICDCMITDLRFASGTGGLLLHCYVTGGTLGSQAIIYGVRSTFRGTIDVSDVYSGCAFFDCIFLDAAIIGGNIHRVLYTNCKFMNTAASLTVKQGTYASCYFDVDAFTAGTVYLTNGSIMIFDGCVLTEGSTGGSTVGIDVVSGSELHILNSSLSSRWAITTTGGNLYTTDSNLVTYPTITSGTWTNKGEVYDNRASGLTATNTQAAIDEIANHIYLKESTISGTPTASGIINEFGEPASLTAGSSRYLKTASDELYLVATDGTDWWYFSGIKAI